MQGNAKNATSRVDCVGAGKMLYLNLCLRLTRWAVAGFSVKRAFTLQRPKYVSNQLVFQAHAEAVSVP